MAANLGKKSGKGEAAGGKGKGKGSGKGGSGAGGSSEQTMMKCVMKFLTPEVLASGLIGKDGAVIAAMRTSCSAKLAFTDKKEFYPSTDCRVFTVQADEEKSLTEVARQTVAKVAEIAKGSNTEGVVGQDDDLKVRTLVPRAAVGGIIGKGGAAINKLREACGAKISISDAIGSGPAAEQIVTITGKSEALETALKEVNTQIQLLNGESWFAKWASSTGTASGTSMGLSAQMPYTGGNMLAPGVDTMMRVASSLPSYVMEDSRGFALSCIVPNRLVGGLIGQGGAGIKEVQQLTGTKINIREIPDDPENRSMNIAGPLASTCAAYMIMMKRYLDAESAALASSK